MDPEGEWAAQLFVHEEPVLFKRRVLRHPCDGADLENHSGASPDASDATDDADPWKRGRQECQGVLPLVKRKHR